MTLTELPFRGSHPRPQLADSIDDNADVILLACFSGDDGLELAGSGVFSEDEDIAIWQQLVAVGATGSRDEVTVIAAPDSLPVQAVAALGLGDVDKLDDEVLRRAAGVAIRALKGHRVVATTISDFGMQAAVEGVLLGGYSYTGYRAQNDSKTAKKPVEEVIFLTPRDDESSAPKHEKSEKSAKKDKKSKDKDKKKSKKSKKHAAAESAAATVGVADIAEEYQRAVITAEQVIFARDLVNTPPLDLYPETYADFVSTVAKELPVECEVYDVDRLTKEGFGGILAVGRGSSRPPRLVKISYQPKNAEKHVALVGKGITFDTGGISLKRAPNMDAMTSDMAGSAAVAAAVFAAARLEIPVKVTAWLPLAENMPSSTAQRPGDVIRHYGGKTSEVLNTDAEGRLVLADAIARASEDKPDYLIETATLTGAQLVALGTRTAGAMGSDDFRDRVAELGNDVGENTWPMPLPEEIVQGVKSSEIADLRNTGTTSFGGMMAAGAYLQAFVGKDIEWVHIDVAGPAYNTQSTYGYTPKRATGAPVRTILATLWDIAAEK